MLEVNRPLRKLAPYQGERPAVGCVAVPETAGAGKTLEFFQKNLREMLNPRYQSSERRPPRAIWPIVDPNEFEKFT